MPQKFSNRRAFLGAMASLPFIGTTSSAIAEAQYPSRPIRFIVAFPPGGGNDFLARLIASKIGELRGWNVVVNNIPGAGGVQGTAALARAEPDGYTFGMGSIGTLSINPSLYKKLPFDTSKDLAPISLFSRTPAALVVPADLPIHSLAELIATAKAHPGKLNFGSAGNGTSHHLAAELFAHRANIKIVHVPYAGSSPAVTGLIRSDTQMMFADLPAVLPMIRAGKLRALAVTSRGRSALLPDVPAVNELLPGFEVSVWYAIVAPAHTPPSIIKTLNQAVRDVGALPEVGQRLAEEGAVIEVTSPEEFGLFLQSEIKRWAEVIRDAKITQQ